ncbi:MAG: type II toxin-antitoxin system RelB/DinJ family antitoxin [Oscillospiraceae bacterium]|nr:type II toxin-antitoxin system RelB/DinJ family antitoxin [Oscillospiraceae bacterium]
MSKTSTIYARVEPEIKEQAENILEQLGLPMSNAISVFLRQVVLHNGLPFDMKLPSANPVSYNDLTDAEFDAEMQKGFNDYSTGRVVPSVATKKTSKE